MNIFTKNFVVANFTQAQKLKKALDFHYCEETMSSVPNLQGLTWL